MASVIQDDGTGVDEGDVNEADDLYDFTEDQIQAMLELDLMQRESAEYPNIEVRERLEELNNALANDPTPTDDSLRDTKVVFKDNLVDLIAPPPEYPSDVEDSEEEEVESTNPAAPTEEATADSVEEEATLNRHINDMTLNDEEEQQEITSPPPSEIEEVTSREDVPQRESPQEVEVKKSPSPTSSTEDQKDEDEGSAQVLVERNGRFILTDNKDVEAEGKAALHHRSPHPPASRRPQSAPQRRSRSLQPTGERRSESAAGDNYNSPYAMTPEMRQERKRRMEERSHRAKSSEQQKRENEKEKKESADAAFQAWLRQKREQTRDSKRNEDKGSEVSSVESLYEMRLNGNDALEKEALDVKSQERSDQAMKEWLKKKRQQRRQEMELRNKQMEQLYLQHEMQSHSQEEVDKAFRSWLRRKNRAAKQAALEERQRARITRLAVRQCRKSQALAFALHRDSSLRYVDYYGYRS